MDTTIQLAGLDRFLRSIYGDETSLPAMIDELGFEPEQSRMLREDCLQDVATQFIDAVRRKLTSGDRDLWFRLLSRRFGLDGEPAASPDEAARVLGIDPGTAHQAEADALQRCRAKATLAGFEKELHRVALAELKKGTAKPSRDQVAAKLTRLADLRAAMDLMNMDYEAKRTEVLKKVQAELDALEAEYDPLREAAENNASALESEIKNDVLLHGKSVSTDVYQAVYMKGRIMWDTAGINKYAVTHPDVLQYRREGQPAVALRTVAKG